MRIKNLKPYYLRKKTILEDNEGGRYEGYTDPVEIKANIYPATGKLQAQIYGERLNYIMNMLYQGTEVIKEGDFISINKNDTPMYKVISIKRFTHQFIELEQIKNG